MLNRKSGQTSGGSAALLVAIIAAMILLYTLFLPPEERAKILEEDDENGDSTTNESSKILLRESPGRLDLIKKTTIEHKISSFNLLSTSEGKVLKEFDSVYAQRAAFGADKPQIIQFDLGNPQDIENALLSFTVKEHSGRLSITLNDKVISDRAIEETNPAPIKISSSALEKSNTLRFSVSSPGLLFYKTNKYSLEDVKIVGDVTDNTGLENTQSFFITELEEKNLEKATLSFMPTCRTNDVGRLDIRLNSQSIYFGIPDCRMPVKIEVGPGRILEGENTMRFSAEKGSYVIDQAKIVTNMKEAVYPTYFFHIDEDTQKRLENNTVDINMSIIFVRSSDFQDVEVEINGRKFSIDNRERIHMETIDPYLREENNAITLRPLDGTVDIVELKIFKIFTDEDEDDP